MDSTAAPGLRSRTARLVAGLLAGVMLQTCCIVCTIAAYMPRITWLD